MDTLVEKKRTFWKFSFPVKDTENWIKHHLFVYKRSITDQNFKGVAQKLGLPSPSQVQNWIGVAGSIFELRPPNFGQIHIFWRCLIYSKIFLWYFQQHKSWKKSAWAVNPVVPRSMTYIISIISVLLQILQFCKKHLIFDP